MFTAEQLKNLMGDPVQLIDELTDKVLVRYRPLVEQVVSNIDIYKLPSFHLSSVHLLDVLDDSIGEVAASTSFLGKLGDLAESIEHAVLGDNPFVKTFKRMDKDGTGALNFEEFLTACKVLQDQGYNIDLDGDGKIVEEAQALFQLIDTSGSGYLTGRIRDFRRRRP